MTNISNPTVLVVSDSTADAALLKMLLDNEFKNVFTSTNPDKSQQDFVRHSPDVLVFAFNALERSQHYYLRLFRLCADIHLKPYRTIILCNKNEIRRAYELCRDGLFGDYIPFWPIADDALRLPMSVHLALRELAVLQDGEPTSADFLAQARRLTALKALLDQQMAQGVQSIEKTGDAVGQVEPGIDAAIRHAMEQAEPGIDAAIREFQQAGAPQLESIRSLNAIAERIRPKVLIVDDDEFQHKIISKMLGGEKYHLVFATGGVEALKIMRTTPPDLVLVDFMMPDMNGMEVIRQLKTEPQLANIPVMMITGKGEKYVITESIKTGAVDFIVKPFTRDTLLGKVAKVLG